MHQQLSNWWGAGPGELTRSPKAVGMFLLAAVVVASGSPPAGKHTSLSRRRLFQHLATTAWSCSSPAVDAFFFKAGLAIDADGAFRAYHPDDRMGLDTIKHAGRPGNWWALATNDGTPRGRPIIQGKNDPAPGFYVSMTALFDDKNSNERDPRRFVDASSIPYVVLPPEGFRYAKLGDFATVVNLHNGKETGAIVADESAQELSMGEGSIALAIDLIVDANPRTGGVEDGIAYVVYPRSGNGKPRSLNDIKALSRQRFESWGGVQKLNSCMKP